MLSAKIILASASAHAKPLYTFKLRYPWQIHGEVMTHRVFSRNASSNRAIPTKKLLEEAGNPETMAYPSFAVVNAPGMQGGRPMTDFERETARTIWVNAAQRAVLEAAQLAGIGCAKQDVNRLLMPFTHANVVLTATEFDNFFGLRLDAAADPTIRQLAELMWAEMQSCIYQKLEPGQWHLPFVDDEEVFFGDTAEEAERNCIKVSVARCARVSYESFETGKRSTIEEDLKLYDKLMGQQPLHASPAEHQATPDVYRYVDNPSFEDYGKDGWKHPEQHGNLVGWRQYRKMLPGEACAPLPIQYATSK